MQNTSAVELEGFLAALFGVFGLVCLWKPDTWGAYIAEYLKRLNRGSEETSTHNTQVQQNSDGSVQVIGDRPQINVNVPKKEEKTVPSLTKPKTFSCPECGRGTFCYPPDDNHPFASLEEDYAQKHALDGYVARRQSCRKCGAKFTLYWYQEGSGAGVVESEQLFGS
jgi:hypothetical protein